MIIYDECIQHALDTGSISHLLAVIPVVLLIIQTKEYSCIQYMIYIPRFSDLSFGFEEESYTMFEDEDAGNLVFIISIEGTTSEQTFNISVVATSITAQENEDFKVMQVVFPANSTRIAVPLKFVNDSRLELVESFRLQLVYGGIGTPFQVGGNIVTTVFINDDDEGKKKLIISL